MCFIDVFVHVFVHACVCASDSHAAEAYKEMDWCVVREHELDRVFWVWQMHMSIAAKFFLGRVSHRFCAAQPDL